jgi:hypothetical protein
MCWWEISSSTNMSHQQRQDLSGITEVFTDCLRGPRALSWVQYKDIDATHLPESVYISTD